MTFKYLFFVSILLLLPALAVTLLLLKKACVKAGIERNGLENTLSALQKKVNEQDDLISSFTKLYNEALEYDRHKTEFFTNITHELKTPISVILGAIQLIDRKYSVECTEQAKCSKQFKVVKQNCYRLLRLINNLLDITRIDSGHIKLNMANCNIVSLVEEITQSVVPYAEHKGLSLVFDTEEEEILTAVDIDKLERIILNLLSNAIKFTGPGGKVYVTVLKDKDRVVISVKDTGAGIPLDMQNRIFERFQQANSSLTREHEGSGIGLSLVKSFVDLHNGTIKVVSEENRGSEFIIEIPIKLTRQGNEQNQSNSAIARGRIIDTLSIEFSDIYTFSPGEGIWAMNKKGSENAG